MFKQLIKGAHTKSNLKISLYVRVHMKIIPLKLQILNPKNSQVTCP